MPNDTKEALRREIGARGIALSTVNLMVGTGIFVLPALVSEGLGATALLAYFVCGGLVFCLALCFAELGSKSTISGGPYTFIERAFGRYPGFVAANLYLLGALASDAALANALSDTLSVFIPQPGIQLYRAIFQFLLFAALAWLNISGVKNGVGFVVFTGLGKLIPLVLLVSIAMPHVEAVNLKWVIAPTITNIGSASLLLFFAFLGQEVSLCNGGEIKNPARNIPLGILGGITTVLILYLSIQIAAQGVLGSNLTNHKGSPLAALASVTIGEAGMMFMLVVTSISILGSLSGEILAMPRIVFAAARDGLMPSMLARVHSRYATPHIAIIVYAGIGYILSISGGFQQLAIIASSSILIVYVGMVLSLLQLRKKQIPLAQKTFRVPGGPVVPLLAAAGATWMLTNSSKAEATGLAIFTLVFSGIYFAMRLVKKQARA